VKRTFRLERRTKSFCKKQEKKQLETETIVKMENGGNER
jgi:hypothetical protein